jgi:hypothetical protein
LKLQKYLLQKICLWRKHPFIFATQKQNMQRYNLHIDSVKFSPEGTEHRGALFQNRSEHQPRNSGVFYFGTLNSTYMIKRKMANRNLHILAFDNQWQCYALPAGMGIFSGVKGKTFG